MLGPNQVRIEEHIKQNLPPLLRVHFPESQLNIESEVC